MERRHAFAMATAVTLVAARLGSGGCRNHRRREPRLRSGGRGRSLGADNHDRSVVDGSIDEVAFPRRFPLWSRSGRARSTTSCTSRPPPRRRPRHLLRSLPRSPRRSQAVPRPMMSQRPSTRWLRRPRPQQPPRPRWRRHHLWRRRRRLRPRRCTSTTTTTSTASTRSTTSTTSTRELNRRAPATSITTMSASTSAPHGEHDGGSDD